jgi:hypothetical protein
MSHWQETQQSAAAEPGNIEKFIISSDYTDDLDISTGIVELHYFESLLENTVRITTQVVDSSLRKAATQGKTGYEAATENDENTEAPGDGNTTITGGEKVSVSFSDNQEGSVVLDGLRVQATRNQIENTKANVFVIDVFSEECLKNNFEETRCTSRYQGKISDSVEQILTENLGTSNELVIDSTLNELTFNGDTNKPFYKCVWLAKRSVPEGFELGGTAGCFFWETAGTGKKTYNFKGIDTLMQQEPVKVLQYTDTPKSDIKAYEFLENVNVEDKIRNGAFSSSQSRTIDPVNEGYESDDNSSSSVESASELGGREHPVIAKDLSLPDKVTKISGKIKDSGSLPKGYSLKKQLERAKEENFDVNAIARQAEQRYNQLFTYKLSVTIVGSFDLRAGQVVECKFPQQEWSDTKSNSVLKGGKYLIVDLCHMFTTEETYTKLNLIRESVFSA